MDKTIIRDDVVLNIPSGINFIRELADFILSRYADPHNPMAITDTLVLLPTRRAKRLLQKQLLGTSEQTSVILPRIHTLGDLDEDDMDSVLLSGIGHNLPEDLKNIPPALPRMRRQIMLARLVEAIPGYTQNYEQTLQLAGALGSFLDHVYTENLSWDSLETLVPENLAEHWQITLDFLKIITREWPKILADEDMIDYADRRNRLLLRLNKIWNDSPPQTPVIIAGSTGSIPAVAGLLKTVSTLPKGHVILPALDNLMDDEDWAYVDPVHPQHGLKTLLTHMEVNRAAVKTLSKCGTPDEWRQRFISETMRPADTTDKWLHLNDEAIPLGIFSNIGVLECQNQQEEALAINLVFRETLEDPEKTAVLVTPDRDLVSRVLSIAKRWNMPVDDSAGTPLSETDSGIFSCLALRTICQHFSPVSLLSLLKHPHCTILDDDAVTALDLALRGLKPPEGFDGLRFAVNRHFTEIEKRHKADPENHALCLDVLDHLKDIFTNIQDLQKTYKVKDLLQSHMHLLDTLENNSGIATDPAFTDFIEELSGCVSDTDALTLPDYETLFTSFISNKTVRPSIDTHTRLRILGQLEARLIDADVVIMAGLNEGTWPPSSKHDPWMSRQMRHDFGLPTHEQATSLAAHDFVQCLSASNVIVTRCLIEDGTPTLPARWLLRMETILKACGYERGILFNNRPYVQWARKLDQSSYFLPFNRPAPSPPVDKRPRKLSATAIEKWLKDPYTIYARYILKLRPLDDLENLSEQALRGSILHETLEQFIRAYPDDLPEDAPLHLRELLKKTIRKHTGKNLKNTAEWGFWINRTEHLLERYLIYERAHRENARPVLLEANGEMTLDTQRPFALTARADRIDQSRNGHIIIDYKSAGSFTKSGLLNGMQTQMPVEALILLEGGFSGLSKNTTVADAQYWVFNDLQNGIKVTATSDKTQDILKITQEKLHALIDAFDQEDMAYFNLPNPSNTLRFNDYEHLSRIREWGVIHTDADSAAQGDV